LNKMECRAVVFRVLDVDDAATLCNGVVSDEKTNVHSTGSSVGYTECVFSGEAERCPV
jgi:hypothetical protein